MDKRGTQKQNEWRGRAPRRRRLIKLTLSEINNGGASRDPRCIMSSRVTRGPRRHPRRTGPSPPAVRDPLGGPPPPSPAHSGSLPSLATHFIATFRPLDYFTLYEGPRALLSAAARLLRNTSGRSNSPVSHPVFIPAIDHWNEKHENRGWNVVKIRFVLGSFRRC